MTKQPTQTTPTPIALAHLRGVVDWALDQLRALEKAPDVTRAAKAATTLQWAAAEARQYTEALAKLEEKNRAAGAPVKRARPSRLKKLN